MVLNSFSVLLQRRVRLQVAFSSSISACARCRQWANALEVLRHMARQGLPATQDTMSALLRALKGRWRPVLQLLELLLDGRELRERR